MLKESQQGAALSSEEQGMVNRAKESHQEGALTVCHVSESLMCL
jgi:hypothetical protein